MALTEKQFKQKALAFFRNKRFGKKPLMDRRIAWLVLDHIAPEYNQSLGHPPTREDGQRLARIVEDAWEEYYRE